MTASERDDRLERSNKLLEAIHRVQSRYIVGGGVRRFFSDLLTVLLDVTDSEYGFIGEVLFTDKGDPYLKTHAISDISWDDATREYYQRNAPRGMEFFNLTTLFGAVMTSGKPVMTNEPASDPRRGGIPEGHPPLDAFLGLPFERGGEMIGMVGIANRPGGYDESIVHFLEPFLSTCGTLIVSHRADIARQRTEEKLREQEDQLAHVTRLSTMGESLAEIAHEVSQPFYSISFFAQACTNALEQGEPDRAQLLDWTRRMHGIALQGGEILSRFSSFVRKTSAEPTAVDVNDVIADSIELLRLDTRRHSAAIEFRPEPSHPHVRIDRTQLQQVVVNLLKNACEAMADMEAETRRARVAVTPRGHQLEIAVEDNGPGLPTEQLERIFNAFYTTKDDGMGMGLSVSRTIIEENGGRMWAGSSVPGGAMFRFLLPLAANGKAGD